MNNTIIKRKKREQNLLLDQLQKTPVVQIACEKVNIGRTSYYRWRQQSKKFTELADQAIAEGNLFMNDMAESQLLSSIKNNHFQAIKFWLQNHHSTYAQKLQLSGTLNHEHHNLTPEQKRLIRKALRFASIAKSYGKKQIRSKNNNASVK
jgi:hypothetical protein